MELHKVSFQADTVTEAIDEFILNLGMAVVIVFVVRSSRWECAAD